MRQLRRGFWCLHCETAWHWVWVVGEHDLLECPGEGCDGGIGDLFSIEGEFEHDEAVEMGSEKFVQLREAGGPFA